MNVQAVRSMEIIITQSIIKKIEFRSPTSMFDSLQMLESVNGKNTGYFIFKGNWQSCKYIPDDDGGSAHDFPDHLIGKWYTMDGKKIL